MGRIKKSLQGSKNSITKINYIDHNNFANQFKKDVQIKVRLNNNELIL